MRYEDEHPSGGHEMASDEREVRELLRAAGSRPPVPAEDLERIREAARAAWRTRQERQARRRAWPRRAILALAASLAVAALAGWFWLGIPSVEATVVATVERLDGEAWVSTAGAERTLAVGETIEATGELRTTSEPVALRTAGGRSVRVAPESRLRLTGPERLELVSGGVYVDADPLGSPRGELRLSTPAGVVEEVGTQFQVWAEDEGALRVDVREGSVSLTGDGDRYRVSGGESLSVGPGGTVERRSIPVTGAPWEWAVAAAPAPQIEGRSLSEFLAWTGREIGREVRYATPELAAAAESIQLHGTVSGLTPDEALEVVLSGSGLEPVYRDGSIEIRRP